MVIATGDGIPKPVRADCKVARALVKGAYDIQLMRMMIASRIITNWKAKLFGQAPGTSEENLSDLEKRMLNVVRMSSKLMANAVVKQIKAKAESDGPDIVDDPDLDPDSEEVGLEEAQPNEGGSALDRAEFDLLAGRKPKGLESLVTKCVKALIESRYKALTDGKKRFPSKDKFKGDPIISSYTELCLVSEYMNFYTAEKQHFAQLKHVVEDFPIWNEYLVNVKGIGPAMASVIITEIDIFDKPVRDELQRIVFDDKGVVVLKTLTPSSLWKLAGLDVGPDGLGRSRREAHLIDIEYVDAKGVKQIKKGITYKPFLKKKLMGVLASSFMRSKNPMYTKIYYDKRNFYNNHPIYGEKNDGTKCPRGVLVSPARRHFQSLRFMIKMFLIDLYKNWRKIEGLPIKEDYYTRKFGPHNGTGHPGVELDDENDDGNENEGLAAAN